MSFLKLNNIGKIYVSEGNISVGIRGVDLEFEKGEFVAITGKSGSGKSTLLNVISGMDTYEEGELYINGSSTSHYLQSDWEEYRKEYISFIFQDYNIIESYTVLQNVELALMHITDKRARRKRALELLEKVGLSKHLHHKGSRLSGGQKQRTVIARALAKDSPIILADEPTGNLDSATSEEIIRLLKEVSENKLLIVVTHNFEQVQEYATRHIRIFDGAVESDTAIVPTTAVAQEQLAESGGGYSKIKHTLLNGITLGKTIFSATPKLSFFLCVLLLIGTLGIFLATAVCGSEIKFLFSDTEMFTHIDGRVIVVKRDGSALSPDELKGLKDEYGAESYIKYDRMIDESPIYVWLQRDCSVDLRVSCEEGIVADIGRAPEAINEVMLYLPIYCQPYVGKTDISMKAIELYNTEYVVTGVKYFVNNNLEPKVIMTRQGFDLLSCISMFNYRSDLNFDIWYSEKNSGNMANLYYSGYDCKIDFGLDGVKLIVDDKIYNSKEGFENISCTVTWSRYQMYGTSIVKNITIDSENVIFSDDGGYGLRASPGLYLDIANEYINEEYKQGSLFFKNDKEAKRAAQLLSEGDYVAVTSDITYTPGIEDTILTTISGIFMLILWIGMVLFIVFFLNLCSRRALMAFKGDMAIMRSMGIPVTVIKAGMYVRMLISLIPSAVIVTLSATVLYRIPKFNGLLNYIEPWQYVLIYLGMLILTFRVTHSHIKRLFNESVKKSLRGGDKE